MTQIAIIDFNQIENQAIGGFSFPNSTATIGDIITSAYPYIFGAAGILVLIYLLYGGIELMISAGDPKKVQSARDKITGAIVGLVIIFVAFWIVQLISYFLGVEALRNSFQ